MSEHVPAWKRIGLKVKQDLEEDPLAITTHLDSGKVTAKQTKQLNKKKRAVQSSEGDSGDKKPPKRQKLPKSERPPPPEKDQLVYLKAYSEDKDNWKFSKQKQNWILKHIKVIEDKYETHLVNYLAGLQGGSKDRLLEAMKKVVDSWNVAASESEKTEETEETKEGKDTQNKQEKKDNKEDLESVDNDYALRARKIVEALSGERLKLAGIDDTESNDEPDKEESDKSTEANSHSPQSSDDSDSSVSEAGSKSSSESEEEEQEKPENEKVDASTSNLVIEQVEVTDFLNDEDYMDPLPQTTEPEPTEEGRNTKADSDDSLEDRELEAKKNRKRKTEENESSKKNKKESSKKQKKEKKNKNDKKEKKSKQK